MTSASKWGNDFRLDGDFGLPTNSTLAGLADGRFVATWDFTPANGTGTRNVHAQIFDADGSRKGGEFIVYASPEGHQGSATVAALSSGGFVVAWEDASGDYPVVRARIFDHDGTASAAQILIDAPAAEWKTSPQLATVPGGGFAATWISYDPGEGDLDTIVRAFNADGLPASTDFQSNTGHFGTLPDVAVLSDGDIIATWEESTGIQGRVFGADGTPASAAFDVSASDSDRNVAVTALADGGFATAWMDPGTSEDFRLFLRVFDPTGNARGPEIAVDAEVLASQFDPIIAQLADGRLVLAWAEDNLDPQSNGQFYDIRAQLFDLDGDKSGHELLVNANAPAFGQLPSLTVLADGRFVVSWDEFGVGERGPEFTERAQIFDAREAPVTLNGTPLDDNWFGTSFDDTMQGASGNDRLDGAAGDDTARYTGTRGQYTISDLGDHFVVAGPDGTDKLYNFEFIQFGSDAPERLTTGTPTPHDPEPTPNTPVGHISGLFDTRYYLSHYTDVFGAGVSALDHYDTFGWHEGRAPNAFFDSTGYLAANPEVRDAGFNPLEHYHVAGWLEERDPSASFDTTLYLIHNPDVAAMHVDPLEHYMQHGMAEGRATYAAVGRNIVGGFDAEYYVFHNPDVAAAGVDPRAHYDQFGWHEGRRPNAWFDSAGYLAHYADVAAAGVNPLDHYQQFGWKEGRDPSAGFDTLGYLAANPDVAAAGVNPLEHYLTFGIYEGRSAVNDGLWH